MNQPGIMEHDKEKKRTQSVVVLVAIVAGGFPGFKGSDLAASIYFLKNWTEVNG